MAHTAKLWRYQRHDVVIRQVVWQTTTWSTPHELPFRRDVSANNPQLQLRPQSQQQLPQKRQQRFSRELYNFIPAQLPPATVMRILAKPQNRGLHLQQLVNVLPKASARPVLVPPTRLDNETMNLHDEDTTTEAHSDPEPSVTGEKPKADHEPESNAPNSRSITPDEVRNVDAVADADAKADPAVNVDCDAEPDDAPDADSVEAVNMDTVEVVDMNTDADVDAEADADVDAVVDVELDVDESQADEVDDAVHPTVKTHDVVEDDGGAVVKRADEPTEPSFKQRSVIMGETKPDPTKPQPGDATAAAAATLGGQDPAAKKAEVRAEETGEQPVAGDETTAATGADAEPQGASQATTEGPQDGDRFAPIGDADGEPVIDAEGTGTVEAEATEPEAEADPVAALKVELAERIEDLQRLSAEYANYRKRTERDRSAIIGQARCGVVAEFLPICDDLDLARSHGDLTPGLKAVSDKLDGIFTKLSVKRFGEPGDTFDPEIHEAVQDISTGDDKALGTVLRPGYFIGDKLVRTAMVIIADPATTDAKATESEGAGAGAAGDGAAGATATQDDEASSS